ncbi:protein suex-1-like [Sitodiplosis mosellana]|uniref:protein suex-1-like n=1 Tax=Sitodiplosis mosellana TaxID=263140 RepID=UPI00244429DB|nr:protein suex-1-like [Sitodiplosis mosellana]
MKVVITLAVFLALFAFAMATPVDDIKPEQTDELQTAEQFYRGYGGYGGYGGGYPRYGGYGGYNRGYGGYGHHYGHYRHG